MLLAVRRQADPHGPAIDFFARPAEHVARQLPLDLLEELTLLPPDMSRQQEAKLLQQRGRRRAPDPVDKGFDPAMIRHQFIDQRHRPTDREEHLLLDFEMVDQLQLVPVDDTLRKILNRAIRGQRSPDEDAQRQPVMMLVRERDQTGVAQHHAYQMRQMGCRTIGWPALQENALENSGILDTTPLMRYSSGACGSVLSLIHI